MKYLFITLCVLITSAIITVAQRPGDLDVTFHGDGKTEDEDLPYAAFATALQPDGKILTAGQGGGDCILLRFHADGQIDNDFGVAGVVKYHASTWLQRFNSVVLEPNGKVIATGFFRDSTLQGSERYFAFSFMARFQANGVVDSSFGIDGKVVVPGLADTWLGANNLVGLQSDGKIVIGGVFVDTVDSETYLAVARYHQNGILDSTFGARGIALVKDANGLFLFDAAMITLAVRPDDKILAAGMVRHDHDFIAIQLNENGIPDSTFGNNGFTDTISGYVISALEVQADGKFVTTGGQNGRAKLARFNVNGTLDNTLTGGVAAAGIITTEFYNSSNGGINYAHANALAVQPDGKIILGGSTSVTEGDFVLARYNYDGSVDTTFGIAGKVLTNFYYQDEIYALILQPDAKLLAAGYTSFNAAGAYGGIALARYIVDFKVGLPFWSNPNKIVIFPNPITDLAVLDYSLQHKGLLTINLHDLKGALSRQWVCNATGEAGNHREQLDFKGLASGNYLLRVTGSGESLYLQVIKQ